jgi:hypothetical protein
LPALAGKGYFLRRPPAKSSFSAAKSLYLEIITAAELSQVVCTYQPQRALAAFRDNYARFPFALFNFAATRNNTEKVAHVACEN